MFRQRSHLVVFMMIVILMVTLAFAAIRGNMKTNSTGQAPQYSKSKTGNSITSITSMFSSISGDKKSSAFTRLLVNGHEVAVPSNGSIDKTYVDENGTTHVNVENHSSESGNSSSVSTTTNVNSTTPSYTAP